MAVVLAADGKKNKENGVFMKKIMKRLFAALLTSLALLQFTGCFLIQNEIVSLDQDVEEAQANIATQYDNKLRRIPELVQVVKSAKNAEIDSLIAVVEARAKAAGQVKLDTSVIEDEEAMAKFQKIQSELNSGIGRLLAVSEAYPELKSQDNFSTLMSEIEGVNNRITVAQTRYNKAVKEYNKYILSFPGSMFAAKWGYNKKIPFQADFDVTKPQGAMDLGL